MRSLSDIELNFSEGGDYVSDIQQDFVARSKYIEKASTILGLFNKIILSFKILVIFALRVSVYNKSQYRLKCDIFDKYVPISQTSPRLSSHHQRKPSLGHTIRHDPVSMHIQKCAWRFCDITSIAELCL